MRRSIIGVMALLLLTAAPVHAQNELLTSCAENAVPESSGVPAEITNAVAGHFQTLCAQVANQITDFQPSVGVAFSGGNPVLGTGSTLGTRLGLPRVSVTARANVALVDLPDVFATGVGALGGSTLDQTTLQALETVGVPIGSLQGDIALGVFDGISLAPMIGGVGSVDVLGSASFVPQIDEIGLSQNIVNYGGGVRLGLLQQGLVAPGISVSAMYRRMGDVSFGDVDAGDPAQFSANLTNLNVRGVISKGILMLDLAVGGGYDQYTSDIAFDYRLECGTTECLAANDGDPIPLPLDEPIAGELSTAAWNVFGNVAMNFLMLNLVGEVGYQKAMDRVEQSDLEDLNLTREDLVAEELSGGRLFGSLGLRISL